VIQLARSKKQVSKKRALVTQTDPSSVFAEEYRNIRTNIEFSSFDKEIKTFFVTSSNPGEGKSTTAANLAVVFAQHGKKVLLVDADLRKPTVHYTFGLNNVKGLSNLLSKQAKLDEIVMETRVSNLYVISSGPTPPNSSRLLASQSMDDFLNQAHDLFDLVILDTPPMLPVADAKVLMRKINDVVFVVRCGVTEIKDAQKTVESINQAKGNLLGVILNDKKQKNLSYYTAYGD